MLADGDFAFMARLFAADPADPSNPVSHPEWARMLLRGLRLEEMVETNTAASQ